MKELIRIFAKYGSNVLTSMAKRAVADTALLDASSKYAAARVAVECANSCPHWSVAGK